jgi:hypothetical protein
VGEDIDAELEQRGVREPAMLREMTLTRYLLSTISIALI